MKLETYAISLEEFIVNYLNIDYLDDETFCKLIHSSHQDLTELGIDNIKRLPFDIVDVDDILRGDVLIVRSGANKHELAPYVRPCNLLYKKTK